MGIILYENLDIGEIPPTPPTPHLSYEISLSLNKSSNLFLEYAKKFGYPIGYIQEQKGAVLQNIVPVHKTEYQQISTSSKVELALHTETAFHPYKPDYVMLLCLRGDSTAVTTYANLTDIIKHISPVGQKMLQEKNFTTGVDLSFRSNGEEDSQIPISIIKKVDGVLTFTYDVTVIKGSTPQAQELLEEVQSIIEKCTQEIILKTGDLLVIDNKKTIHGRKPFQARYDGTDRWVQRILVRKKLPPENQRVGNIIITSFTNGEKNDR